MRRALANFKRAVRREVKRRFWRTKAKLTSHPDVPSVVIAYNRFGAYCLPRSSLSRAVCQTVLRGDVWESEVIAFMCARAGSGDIIHAGAYFGDFLPALSKAIGPAQRVWAFEPLAESYRCAKATIALNDLNNIDLRQFALGAAPGVQRFASRDSQGRSLGGESRVNAAGTETVTEVRLDDIIPVDRQISILQLDVEGYESKAIEGARDLIRRCHPIIILESEPEGFAENYRYRFDLELDYNRVYRPA